MRNWGLVAVVLFVMAGVVATPSSALAAGWLPTTLVSSPGEIRSESSEPGVATSPNGDTTVVWSDEVNPSGLTVLHRIQSRTYFVSGAVGPTRTLSDTVETASEPKIAVDANGVATVAWSEGPCCNTHVEFVRLDPSGVPLGTPEPVSPDGQDAFEIGLDVNSSGQALVDWTNGSTSQAQFVRIAAEGSVGTVTDLSQIAPPNNIQDTGGIAIDDEGRGFASWSETDDCSTGCHWTVRGRTFSATDTLNPIRQLSDDSGFTQSLRSVIDSQGTGTAVWTAQDSGSSLNTIYANRVDAAGDAGSTQIVSDDTVSSFDSDAAVGPDGAVTVLFQEVDAGLNEHLRTRQLSAAGGLGPINPIADGNVIPGGLAVGTEGGLATYTSQTPTDFTDRATARPIDLQGAASGPQAVLSDDDDRDVGGDQIQAAVGAEGSGFVAWPRANPDFVNDYLQVEGAAFDGTPPALNAVIPAAGTAGQSLVMAATAKDRSAVGLAWNFGDGGQASGEVIQHTYSAPGTYTLTVTGTDAVGNVATAQGQVRISPAGTSSPATTQTGKRAAALKKCKKISKKKKKKRRHCIKRAKKRPL